MTSRDTQQTIKTTTTTTGRPTTGTQGYVAPGSTKEVVTNVLEKPVLQNVIEKKDVEIHHKPVVQEIREQKVIEVQKQPVMQTVQQQPVIQQTRAAPVYESVGTGELGEQERLRLQNLKLQSQPTVQTQQQVHHVQEGATVGSVLRQENIERHVQPVVTEVRNQKVMQEVVQPVVRTVHEAPIIREVSAPLQTQPLQTQTFQTQSLQTQPLQQTTWQQQQTFGTSKPFYSTDTGRFQTFAPGAFGKTTQGDNLLKALSVSGKNYIYGLTNSGELYHLGGRTGEQSWQPMNIGGFRLRDISVARGGHIFGIGMDGHLYRFGHSTSRFELVVPNDHQRLMSISAMSKRKIYAISEDGSPIFLKLPRFGTNYVWERLGSIKLNKISTGGRLLRRTEVWGLGQNGAAYRWFNDQWVPFNVQLRDISVAFDNAVYGISMEGRLLKWNGEDLFLLQDRELKGDNRDYIKNARLSKVSAYKEGNQVFGIEEGSSNLLRMLF